MGMQSAVFSAALLALAQPVFAARQAATSKEPALVKARRLVEIMGSEKTMTDQMTAPQAVEASGMFLTMKIVQANPGKELEVKEAVAEAIRATIPKVVPAIAEYQAGILAATFTPQEIDSLAAFFGSKKGRKLLSLESAAPTAARPTPQELEALTSFFKEGAGKKFQSKSLEMGRQLKLYVVDVSRKKQRELIYAQLREELPKKKLAVPDPFMPDTFIDKKLHDNAVRFDPQPSPDFLIPTPEAIPEGYKEFTHSFRKSGYGFQYDRWEKYDQKYVKRVAQLFISENLVPPDQSYESAVQFQEGRGGQRIKEFSFQGSEGVVFKSRRNPRNKRESYQLFWKDGSRILRISNVFEEGNPSFSPDVLIEMLKKFKRVE